MKSFWMRAAYMICGLALPSLALQPAQKPTTTARIANAANAFLSTLDDNQRQTVVYWFDDEEQRKRWSNFPTPVVPRGGINLKQMSTQQRAAVMELLSVVLSPMGLEKVNQIRMADDDYKVNGSQHRSSGACHATERAVLRILGPTVRHHNRVAEEDRNTVIRLTETISSEAISTTFHFLANPP